MNIEKETAAAQDATGGELNINYPEYDPSTCITAGELRAMGIPIPDHVPDCGWVPRSALRPKSARVEPAPGDPEAGVMRLGVELSFTRPFHWVTVDLTITKRPPDVST